MFRFNVNNHAKIDIEREEDPNDPVEIQLLSPMMTTDFLVGSILFEPYLTASWIISSDFLEEFYYALSIYIYICSG